MFEQMYRTIFTSREIDRLELQYIKSGEAYFHVSGAGHEAVAALNQYLIHDDYLMLHYRDKALMLARGMLPQTFFHSLFCTDASHSRGRQMSAHMSSREHNIISLPGPVGNNALQAVGIAAHIKDKLTKPLVLCALGDGASQQGEVLEAVAEAARRELPVLFLIEDNHYAISTTTARKTFYDLPRGHADEFYGIPIQHFDGWDVVKCCSHFDTVIRRMRESRQPAIMHMNVERLTSHTNADDQTIYRSAEEIEEINQIADPVANLRKHLIITEGIEANRLDLIEREICIDLITIAKSAYYGEDPVPTFDAKKPLPAVLVDADSEYTGNTTIPRLTMLEAIRNVLKHWLETETLISLYGEDIEDPKGDVFGVTKGLSTAFPGRVVNSPLSESTIVGTSIGRALAGGRPVAFVQFADFLPLAFNQIISELGSIYWRTDGAWRCPVIILAACGGYRPGLGPFHAQSMESIVAHIPGIDVMMPSTAGDAAGLLNAAFESQRPTIFLYPKSSLNLPDQLHTTSADVFRQLVPLGTAKLDRFGDDITFVSYGNTVELCRKAADALATVDIEADIIDLRCLSPWDKQSVITSAKKTKRVIVVHEDNSSCGLGAEIISTINEAIPGLIHCRRIARPDTYVPCHFGNQLEILPSYKRVLSDAADMLNMEITWQHSQETEPDTYKIKAIGTSPSDETVLLVEWYVREGDMVTEGQTLAAIEASKAAYELTSPVSGVVQSITTDMEQEVTVGSEIATIRLGKSETKKHKPANKEHPGMSIITKKLNKRPIKLNLHSSEHGQPRTNNDSPISRLISTYNFNLKQWQADHPGERLTIKKLVAEMEAGLAISPMEEQYFDKAFKIWKTQQAFTFRSNSDEVQLLNNYGKELKSLMLDTQSPFGTWLAFLQNENYFGRGDRKDHEMIGWILTQPITNNPITRRKMCEISLYVIDPTAVWTPSVTLMKTVLKKLGDNGVEFVYGHSSPKNKESIALLKEVGFVNYGRVPKNLHTGILRSGFRIWGYSLPCVSDVVLDAQRNPVHANIN